MDEFRCQKCNALLGIFPEDTIVKCTCGMEYEIDPGQKTAQMGEFECLNCRALLGIFPEDIAVKCICGMMYEIDRSQSTPKAMYHGSYVQSSSGAIAEKYALSALSEKERKDAQIVCPHCNNRGLVRTQQVRMKRGISGGKATAAVFTFGWSMLATGLSRKETMTEARCNKCGSIWHF